MKLSIKDVSFFDLVYFPLLGNVRDKFIDTNYELYSGKCYCFDSDLTRGGWGLSWVIAGAVKQYSGDIICDGKVISQKERKKISQCVGMDVTGYHILGKKTIKNQLIAGLKATNYKNAKNIEEIIETFEIDKEKIDRNIEHVSASRFRMSIGIGYAYDKKIYCFPWLWQESVLDFKDLWLKKLIDFLKSKDCLIILPTKYTEAMCGLFDEIIRFNQPTA
jgi:ABC-type sugar transport system ATPase subunit